VPRVRIVDRRLADPLVAAGIDRDERDDVLADWAELCEWDPTLPPGTAPRGGGPVVDAVAAALGRHQPIGWGPDAEVEDAVRRYAALQGSVAAAVGTLACMREAVGRRLRGRVPADEVEQTWTRLGVIVDRAIGVAAQRLADRLEADALTDELTGLGNRRALERALQQELARAARHERQFSVVVIDLDGLKRINDTEGHAAGDAALRRLAAGLMASLRAGDRAYRLGGDEFALVLPETAPDRARHALERLVDAGAPAMSWGVAAFPLDGRSSRSLLERADQRLYAHKSRPRP
jgi:diguanylate cyclase (GGDEF)-like protein